MVRTDGAVGHDRIPVHRATVRTTRAIAIAVGFVVFVTMAVLVVSGGAADGEPLVGQVAPELRAGVVAGVPVDLGAERGRWVVVNFFAPWCTECIVEHPELRSFADEHEEDGQARLVSVVVDSTRRETEAFLERHPPQWTYLMDGDGHLAVAYGLAKVPETYVVAPNGIVVTKLRGAVTADQLDRVIRTRP